MGSGASADHGALKAKVYPSDVGDNYFIPLSNLASHLHVYQHCTTGEIMILVDHMINDIGRIIDTPNDWFPVTVSKKESKYLESLKVHTSLSERDGQSSDDNFNRSFRTNESIHQEIKRHDSVGSLKMGGPGSDKGNQRRLSEIADPSRKGKLPPISIPTSLFGNRPSVESSASSDHVRKSKRFQILGSQIDDSILVTPKISRVDATSTAGGQKECDSDFGSSPGQTKESPSANISLSRKSRGIRGLRLSDDSALFDERAPDDALILEKEVEVDADMISSAIADCCCLDSSTVLARLVRENLVYNAESRTHCCQICGDVADDSYPIEQVKEQVMRCITKRELQSRFTDINTSLESSILIMSESNRFQMALVFCKAMIIFEKRCTLNSLALSLTKKVASVPYYASDGKWLSELEEEIKRVRSLLLSDLREHSSTVNEGGSDREVYEEMKRLYRILGSTVIQIHAKRRALRMFDQYIMDVSDFTFVRRLSTGAFAKVFLARRKDTGQYCAIKVMDKTFIKQRDMVHQVLRERSIMSSIVTSNARISEMFVRMFSAFQSRQSLYIAMEFVQGGDCLSMLTTMVRFPEKMARHCVAEVALALKYLHEHGVVHRDVKPDNVMITVRGHIKLTDFGLAAPWVKDSSTLNKKSLGTNDKDNHQGINSDRSSDGNSSEHSNSFSTARRSSSNFDGLCQDGSLSRSASPKKGPQFEDLSPSNFGELELSVRKKSGDPLRVDSFDISSRYSSRSQLQNSASDQSRSIWLERSLGRNAVQDSADHTSESSLVFRRVGHSLLLRSAIGGNYLYASPEAVMHTGYDHTVDWWALGVLLFHFLAGVTPFMAESKERSMEFIVTGKIQWESLPPGVSESAKRVICDLLSHLRTARLGYESDDKVLQHEYFDGIDFKTLYMGPGPFAVEFCGAGDTRYFDANSALAISRNDEASEFADEAGTIASSAPIDGDLEHEIDAEDAEDDEFMPFTANPR